MVTATAGGRRVVAVADNTGERTGAELPPTPRSDETQNWGKTIEGMAEV